VRVKTDLDRNLQNFSRDLDQRFLTLLLIIQHRVQRGTDSAACATE